MKASSILDLIKTVYPTRRTLCIESSPGTGKTSIVRQAAGELEVPYHEIHLPTSLVEDFGIPTLSDGKVRHSLPEWFPVRGEAPDQGILCFDDRNQASPDLQKVLANICQARTLHGVPMANWMVISTGNRRSDGAGAGKVLTHLRNRETVINYDVSAKDWSRWAADKGIHHLLPAYFNWQPSMLNSFDPKRDINPTPRAWAEGVAPFMDIDPSLRTEMFMGAVGEEAALSFLSFMEIASKLPDMGLIFTSPETAEIPTDLPVKHAVCGKLTALLSPTDKNPAVNQARLSATIKYLSRLGVESKEFSVLVISDLMGRCKAFDKANRTNTNDRLMANPDFITWLDDNADLLLG
jgi:hypothetical protein